MARGTGAVPVPSAEDYGTATARVPDGPLKHGRHGGGTASFFLISRGYNWGQTVAQCLPSSLRHTLCILYDFFPIKTSEFHSRVHMHGCRPLPGVMAEFDLGLIDHSLYALTDSRHLTAIKHTLHTLKTMPEVFHEGRMPLWALRKVTRQLLQHQVL